MNTRKALACFGPHAGTRFELQPLADGAPKAGEIEVAVTTAAVNPIDVRRAEGYGTRLMTLMKAGRFPLVLGNDFAGTVSAVGPGVKTFAVGDHVFGVKPASAAGTHTSHVVTKATCALPAPSDHESQALAALPYSFITMWLALQGAGLSADNASGKEVLVHGASGGLGMLSLQLLSAWGARVTAIGWPVTEAACRAAGATEVFDCAQKPLKTLTQRFDATLNFATWDDDLALVGCLREGALGHATTVHPLLSNFDRLGWIRGAVASVATRRRHAAALPAGCKHYAWTVFRPAEGAIAELRRQVANRRLYLPIGCVVPIDQAEVAFSHVLEGKPGRALLLPAV
ncbi:alcohol dehydrogenase catalytic domain-containing protein [uncultured Ralstonia sp.]|jgi:NADPH:quinone reductase-like Zn-dependent oxidoreductase|uniref:alcohol dehydrogenase catalytic domain-containing protein n=1 Tax=uncultured Ralstonia sp. TaxID=114715 RepID=UPI001EAC698A|nr:alcohol dehydrogenase catalytic domain-containing protein [uncultured Ralstonia sp.]UCF22592.1 MAG: alcohol dehydrogenase catalytic domain-containing protein [Ralstonia sp.]